MHKKIFLGLAAFLLGVLGVWYVASMHKSGEVAVNQYEKGGQGTYVEAGATFQRVRSEDLGISFAYRAEPDGYVLSESSTTEAGVAHTYTLMNAKDVADLAASSGVPREGPPVMMVKIFENPQHLSVRDWTHAHERDTNTTADTALADTMVGGAKAVSFGTSGLYQSQNIVADNNGKIYFILGEYDSSQDLIAKDFAALLKTLVLF